MSAKKPHLVGSMTLTKLRTQYSTAWGREWPEPNDYLKELWLEAREAHHCRGHVPIAEVWATCLELMRESDEF